MFYVGTTKARNLYGCLYTYATNEINANTDITSRKIFHT